MGFWVAGVGTCSKHYVCRQNLCFLQAQVPDDVAGSGCFDVLGEERGEQLVLLGPGVGKLGSTLQQAVSEASSCACSCTCLE